tara:strand:- start:570 stop:992 length:423 start_codon:yes stop_codon:yes gene_type:complete
MVEFNPDGSIKLPGWMEEKDEQNKEKLRSQRCIKVRKELISYTAPKKCVLHITLSEVISDNRFIDNIYKQFIGNASVPMKIRNVGDRQFEVEVGTDFRRCTDCCSLIYRYREFLDGNVIEEKGSCTFEGRRQNFCYEDMF